MESEMKSVVFSKSVVEFVTVSLEYCLHFESFEEETAESLSSRMTKLLPLLYLKATMLPETDVEGEETLEICVTEEYYNFISGKLYDVFAKDDTYLEVFLEDMKYSDTPISASISEDLTDIYQDLKNFLYIYEQGVVENMNDALSVCNDNFKHYWGQKLVNVLRALHMIQYGSNDEYDENETYKKDEEW